MPKNTEKTVRHFSRLSGHLKKTVHPNRYFIWALFLILIAGSALAGYIIISSYSFDRNFIFSDITSRKVFTDLQKGYSARYPGNWVLERDQNGNMVFDNPRNIAESITVYSGEQGSAAALRKSLKITAERNIARDNLKIDLISALSGKNQLNVALISSNTKFFYLEGYSPTFEEFVNNFRVEN